MFSLPFRGPGCLRLCFLHGSACLRGAEQLGGAKCPTLVPTSLVIEALTPFHSHEDSTGNDVGPAPSHLLGTGSGVVSGNGPGADIAKAALVFLSFVPGLLFAFTRFCTDRLPVCRRGGTPIGLRLLSVMMHSFLLLLPSGQ